MTHPAPPHGRKKSRTPIIAIIVLLIILLTIGVIPRIAQRKALAADVHSVETTPTVSVGEATRVKPTPLSLPGTIQALHETMVYARASGYVRRWYADIGQHVGTGQLLADIESPEVDQELQQARATLKQANATLALAKNDLDRWRALERDSAVSHQELDQKTAAYEAGLAAVHAQEANVQRLASVQGYERIVAPFSGTITARNLDVGSLVTPGATSSSTNSGGTGGQGLFRIAQTDTMRVYVSVPQSLAPAIAVGQHAQVSVQERRGEKFDGQVVRTSNALDPSTRTLLVEVDVPNPKRLLLSGSFAQITLLPTAAVLPVTVPANALLVNAQGTQVATIDEKNVVHYHKVEVGRDYGTVVEMLSGIDEGSTVLLNPSDDVPDGTVVHAVKAPAAK